MEKLTKYYNKRPVLVTGGAGFIGSILTKKLVEAGARVTVLDNFSSGTIENLAPVLHKIQVVTGDITNPETCEKATLGKTHIFHLAAAISVAESHQLPEKYQKINVEGTENLLKAALKNSVQRFVFSSSAAVYGDQTEPCQEELELAPCSPYAQTKIDGENLCKFFSGKNGLKTVSLRYFNVYGPTQRSCGGYAAVIPTFTQKLQQKLPITIFGNGLQTRDFILVDEVAKANMLAGFADATCDPVINIASGKSTTLLQLIDELVTKMGCGKPVIEFLPQRPGDILKSAADCSRYVNLKKQLEKSHVGS